MALTPFRALTDPATRSRQAPRFSRAGKAGPSRASQPAPAPGTARAQIVPGLLVLVIGVGLTVDHGGYSSTTWTVAAGFVGALLLLVLLAGRPSALPRTVLVALLGGAGLCAFSYASIAWAAVPADALEGANRTAFYVTSMAVLAATPWPRRAVLAALAVVGGGLALVALGLLVVSALGDDPAGLFIGGRLSDPVGYSNATANVWLIGAFCLLALAIIREVPRPARVAALAGAALLVELSLLSQSRGAVIALGAMAVFSVAVSRRRLPVLGALAAVGAATAAASGALFDVLNATGESDLGPALADARTSMALSVAGVLALGGLAHLAAARGWLERLRPLANGPGERVGVPALAVVAVVGALAVVGNPVSWTGDRWDDFKSTGYEQVETSETRLSGGLGSNRYDFYRVAWNEFEAHPVAGIGVDNFQVAYLQDRRSAEAPRYPHSLPLRALAQTGLVGSALLALLLLPLCWLGLRAARRPGPEAIAVIGALGAFGAWAVHGAADWLWEFPALTIIALGLLVIAARATGGGAPAPPRAAMGRGRFAVLALVPALAIALTATGLGARYESDGRALAKADPQAALKKLERAAALDPLSGDPLLTAGLIRRGLGDRTGAERALRRVLAREPKNWFAHLELGLLYASDQGVWRRLQALDHVERAERLNPSQPVLRQVRRQLEAWKTPDTARVEADLNGQLQQKLNPGG